MTNDINDRENGGPWDDIPTAEESETDIHLSYLKSSKRSGKIVEDLRNMLDFVTGRRQSMQ
jgi:hypothetical protein